MTLLRGFLAACLLWVLAGAAQAITVNNDGAAQGWSGTTYSLTLAGNITAGNVVFVSVYEDSGFSGYPTITDTAGDVFTKIAGCNDGGFESQASIYAARTTGLSTGNTITYASAGGSTTFSTFNVTDAALASGALSDGGACHVTASGGTSSPSGSVTPTVAGDLFLGFAAGRFAAPTFTQSTGFATPPNAFGAANNAGMIGGNLTEAGTTAHNYSPTSAATGSVTVSVMIAWKNVSPPFNPKSGGLMGGGPSISSQNASGCQGAPAPAAAAGYCTQTWRIQPGEFNTVDFDKSNGYTSGGFRAYFDQCGGQTGTTGSSNTTLSGTSGSWGNGSGGYQANVASGTCKGNSWVGTAFGGGGYFEVTVSFTAASVAGTWQAPLWLNGMECSPLTNLPACNWTGQQTNTTITAASYTSATGVLAVTTSAATTIAQYSTAILTSVAGTGNASALNGATCYSPNAVTASTSFSLTCTAGLGTLALTSGSVGQVYKHYAEFDVMEMFMGNFGDLLTQWQWTEHDWYGTSLTNYPATVTVTPGQVYFSSPHTYAALWTPATGSTSGSICVYADGVSQGCQTWAQFVNNGAQTPPPSGSTPWAFGVADLQHFFVYSGCTNANPCTVTLMDVWQANANGNITQ